MKEERNVFLFLFVLFLVSFRLHYLVISFYAFLFLSNDLISILTFKNDIYNIVLNAFKILSLIGNINLF